MNNNKQKNTMERKPTNKGTWVLLIILAIVVIGISTYQMYGNPKDDSINYLTIGLSVLVILSSVFNLLRKPKKM